MIISNHRFFVQPVDANAYANEDNSQTFSNSEPTLGNANSNSMKELVPQGDLEDRRAKKRQRKQDKTKKMQSKLTY